VFLNSIELRYDTIR